MKTLKIKSTEVIDNAVSDIATGKYQPSEISVLVKIEIGGKEFNLDFQTTTTYDYGAFSSDLAAYDGTDDYSDLEDFCSENNIDFQELLKKIKTESNAQQLWVDHINENYVRNEDHFGGMDANSEINEMIKRD